MLPKLRSTCASRYLRNKACRMQRALGNKRARAQRHLEHQRQRAFAMRRQASPSPLDRKCSLCTWQKLCAFRFKAPKSIPRRGATPPDPPTRFIADDSQHGAWAQVQTIHVHLCSWSQVKQGHNKQRASQKHAKCTRKQKGEGPGARGANA